jgi:hypothetical protein
MVLLAALGAGVGLAILLGQMHPTFATRDVLQNVTRIPVIGSITAAVREVVVPWYRRQPAMVGGAVGLLLMVFVLNLVLTESIRATIRAVTG